jgi:hypothetical protein
MNIARRFEPGLAGGICRYGNMTIILLFGLFIFVIPGLLVMHELAEANPGAGAIPKFAWAFHRTLSPKFEKWAQDRIDSKIAVRLTTDDISGTEWPVFGSAFYLWATESLQDAWDKDHSLSPVAPNVYARGAIETVTRLMIDPTQANWVKIYWGTNYLKTENVFYRMLVISALTSHARLTGETQYLPMLRDQVESLSQELDASPHGLCNDYPAQCFPSDVVAAVAMIRKADGILHTDHSRFVARAIRGFQAGALDSRGLVPYFSNTASGLPVIPSRGCGNSYVSLFAPVAWPDQARQWYDSYSKFFWQERWTCAGFREFPNHVAGHNWYVDVDSGPVWGGFGCAACAFGLGAARANGHFEQAYPLTAEMIVTSWPLLGGTRLVSRLLSDATDAPLVGESSMLFNLTRMPAEGTVTKTGGSIPGFVYLFLTLQLAVGLLLILAAVRLGLQWHKNREGILMLNHRQQFAAWLVFLFMGLVLFASGKPLIALVFLVAMQLFPQCRKRRNFTPPAPTLVAAHA